MLAVVPMFVVQRQAASNPVTIIQDDRASRIAELNYLGMGNSFARDSEGLAEQKPDRIEIMNGVIEDLEAWRPLQELPQLPWLPIDQANLDIGHGTQCPLCNQVAERQHVWTEAQLKVDRRLQVLRTA